jgi:NAD(P)H-nitrite reductase large subunit
MKRLQNNAKFSEGTMKNDILTKGAILQRDKETYAIAPHIPGGITNPETLRKVCDVADKYNVKVLKITSAQRIALVGIKEEDLDNIWSDLAEKPAAAIGLCVRSVKICPGTTFCKRAMQDSVSLGLKLDDKYYAMELPDKLKIGVSGCMLSCAEVHVKDIGIMGTPFGWKILVGGCAGLQPRLADVLVADLGTEGEVIEIVEKVITYFKSYPRRQRIGRIIDEIGIAKFKEDVLNS